MMRHEGVMIDTFLAAGQSIERRDDDVLASRVDNVTANQPELRAQLCPRLLHVRCRSDERPSCLNFDGPGR